MLIQKAFITGVGSHIKHLDKKMSNELGITVENFTKYNTAYINGDNTDSSFFGSFRENNVFKKKKTVTARLDSIKKKISAHEKAVESTKSPESAKYKEQRNWIPALCSTKYFTISKCPSKHAALKGVELVFVVEFTFAPLFTSRRTISK